MRYLGKIHDVGKNWKITELEEVSDSFYVDTVRYLILDKEDYDKLKELSQKNELYFSKDDEKFMMDNLIVEEMDPLFYAKYRIKNALTNSFKGEFSNIDLFVFLKYVSLSSELSDKGHYLYIDNLDQKIEEIEKLNNHKLLEKTKELAGVIREIEPHMSSFDRLTRVKKEIDKCSTEQQIRDIINKDF